MITLEIAQTSANRASGENAPRLALLSSDNVIEIRKDFLLNVAYNGKRTHQDIINVLEYMSQFCEEEINDAVVASHETNENLEIT